MSVVHSEHLRSCGQLARLRITAPVVAFMLLTVAAGAFGQDDDARFSNWTKVESAAEARTYKDAMRGSGAFDAASRGFLEEIALPQLALEANRSTIERVRKRMREFLLADIANEKAADEANKTCLTFMEALAGKEDADAVVRVNAMLLIGELQSVDRKPWQPAAAVLARSVANTELPKAVRIAACVGLARHVEATKGVVEDQQRMATVAVPVIVAILKEPMPPTGAVENDWMASRCLAMLPLLGPLAPATAAEVVRILDDGNRSINVRVRAAASLAAVAGPDSKVDKATAIKSIEAVAIQALEGDVAAADKLLLDRQYGGAAGSPGGGPPGMMPGMTPGMMPGMTPPGMMPPGMGVDPSGQPVVPQLIPREACRRAAWRLVVLADAVLSDDAKRGIALLGGNATPEAVALAQTLRRAAMELDAQPDEAVLRQALMDLKPAAPAAPAGGEGPAGKDAPAAAAK